MKVGRMTTALHTLRVEQGCESVNRDFCIPGGIDLSVEEYNRIYRLTVWSGGQARSQEGVRRASTISSRK